MLNSNRLRRPLTAGLQHGFIALAAQKYDSIISPFMKRAFSSRSSPSPSQNDDDDDFKELGSPVPKPSRPKSATGPCKLMTEKPEPYNKKVNGRRKASAAPTKSSTDLENGSSKLGASKRTVSPDRVSVKCDDRSVRPLDEKEAVTIRITNIDPKTTDFEIHSECMLYGSVDGLVRTKEDVVDAFFSIKQNFDIHKIVAKLNDTVMNSHKWSAHLFRRDSASAVMSKESKANRDGGLHICRELAELKRKANMKALCTEDLEYLHNSLMHLEAHPDRLTSISKDVKAGKE